VQLVFHHKREWLDDPHVDFSNSPAISKHIVRRPSRAQCHSCSASSVDKVSIRGEDDMVFKGAGINYQSFMHFVGSNSVKRSGPRKSRACFPLFHTACNLEQPSHVAVLVRRSARPRSQRVQNVAFAAQGKRELLSSPHSARILDKSKNNVLHSEVLQQVPLPKVPLKD